jgi:hypothetical protein
VLPDGTTAPIAAEPLIRVLHLAAAVPAVNVYANMGKTPAFEDVGFEAVTGWMPLLAGTYDFQVSLTPDGPADAVLELNGAMLGAGDVVTALAYGDSRDPGLTPLNDSPEGLALTDIRINVFHGAAGVADVDIWEVTDMLAPILLAEDVPFGTGATLPDLAAGTYRIGLDVDDDGMPDLVYSTGELMGGQVLDVVAVNPGLGRPVFLGVALEDGTYAKLNPM